MRMFLNAALALKSTWFKKQVIIYLQIDFVGVRGINILQNVIINFISASLLVCSRVYAQAEQGSVCPGAETIGWHDEQFGSVTGAEELRINVIYMPA